MDMTFALPEALDQRIAQRADVLRMENQVALWKQTDRLFAVLLAIQWLAGIAMATWLSPWAWEGLARHVHPHIWAAVFLGGLIAALPIGLAIMRPGRTSTRMFIAVAQMLHSAMLIHLSGGRIETHFHVFGSLAFLSFYRDWRVLVPATFVVALDHALRGIYWPESAFGVLAASPWRWVEHAGWVVFEDIILVWSCLRGARELAVLAMRQAQLEATNERVEAEVARQTSRLESVTNELVSTARRAGMAEIATGVLHNVGNVLNSVNVSANVALSNLQKSEVTSLVKVGQLLTDHKQDIAQYLSTDQRGRHLPDFLVEVAQCIGKEQDTMMQELQRVKEGLDHIKQIVGAQQQHAKTGVLREKVSPAELMEQAIAMNPEISADPKVVVERDFEPMTPLALDKHRVLQILINLLSNAKKSVHASPRPDKKIVLRTRLADGRLRFEVTDNGVGIPPENLTRIFAHGFTTSEEGHGFGLHSAANAAREMDGALTASSEGVGHGAMFVLDLPVAGLTAAEQMMASRRKETPCPI